MPKAKELTIALFIGVLAGAVAYAWQASGWSDVYSRLCNARALLAGLDPYAACPNVYRGSLMAEYPLTTILAFVPLSFLPDRMAASVFWAFSNFLLAYGILRHGKPYHWLIYLSGAYWATAMWQQFSVLLCAVMLLPQLLPLTLLKPQTGLPIAITFFTWRRALACAVFLALAFVIYPAWPVAWLRTVQNYDGIIPLTIPIIGWALLLAALRWRDPDSRFLFLMACVPQRMTFDALPLLMLPKTDRQMFALCMLSWIPGGLVLLGLYMPEYMMPLVVLCIYLPLLAMQNSFRLEHIRQKIALSDSAISG